MARTVVLVHGLWITAASWDGWAERYRQAGHEVVAPAYPGMDAPVEELRGDAKALQELTVGRLVDHFAAVASGYDRPILIGHSFGGVLVQLLLDRGIGAAGVAIASAGPRGIRTIAWSQIQALWPALRNPANRRGLVPVTPEGFAASAANALPPAEARAAYDRDIVPAPGRLVFDLALSNAARRTPLRVDYRKPDRAPLLFIAGGEDRMSTPKYVRENVRRQSKGGALTAYKEFPGRSHYIGQAGWEDVADFALDWALAPRPL